VKPSNKTAVFLKTVTSTTFDHDNNAIAIEIASRTFDHDIIFNKKGKDLKEIEYAIKQAKTGLKKLKSSILGFQGIYLR
jgi:hypothetical protein